jgi:hypothetical protein
VANPTNIVPGVRVPFGDTHNYWPIPSAADIYFPGELIGKRDSDGMAQHCDDTQALTFVGVNTTTPRFVVTTDLPANTLFLRTDRPRLFSMPLASGAASRLTDINKPVYAVDSGHVQLGSAGLVFANLIGYVADVLTAKPEDVTGTSVLIEPQYAVGRMDYARALTAPATGGKTYGNEAINAVIFVPNTAAETLTLPPIANTMPNDTITVIKTTAAAFAVTLKGNAAETINGANTYATTSGQFASAVLLSDGTQWIVTNGKVL